MFKPIDPKKTPAEREKKIMAFWKENQVFEKSIENRREAKAYSFFDGPPFITGLPHYGTLLPSISKDVVPRYFTMKGYRVDRRWGWDCHGLPAENLVEKRLGIKSKKEIEEKIGIEKFIKECFLVTNQIASEWEFYIERIGRWVDMKNSYKTMDPDYMESVWWAFKELHSKGLVYKDTRISLYCPRCATPLANFEIAMDSSYQEVTDDSAYIKFEADKSAKEKLEIPFETKAYFVAWTTTPWTLLANTALAVSLEMEYAVVSVKKGKSNFYIIISNSSWERLKKENNFKGRVIKKVKGEELISLRYLKLIEEKTKPEQNSEEKTGEEFDSKGWRIIAGNFVNEGSGSGIVHLAPAFGEDDYNAVKENNLPVILNVDEEGKFTEGKFKGRNVWDANSDVIKFLEKNKLVFAKEKTLHSYPFCHRCHTKLIYKIQPAWFVKISAIRDKLVSLNEEINWHPKFLKKGRFLKGIENAPEWNISRDRYWGTAIPVWACEGCNKEVVVGSYDELYKLSGQRLEDYHRPYVDNITFKCPDCDNMCRRVPQILDGWVESGSMPFAERHYPFKNQEDFNQKFPADFISEYIGQTRAWFYVLHVMAIALFEKPAFKNVVTTGVIAGEDGRKMSKSLGNYPDPGIILEKYSADALRFYLMSSPVMEAEDINFSEEKVAEIQRGMLRAWWNSYFFFVTYARLDSWEADKENPFKWSDPRSFKEAWQKPNSILDLWILSELHVLIRDMNKLMDDYEIAKAARLFPPFIDKLSNWYIRRSRKRFWKNFKDEDKSEAYQTLYEVITKFNQVAAPFAPFITEEIFQNINSPKKTEASTEEVEPSPAHSIFSQISVHLTDFPQPNAMLINEELNRNMERIRSVVTLGLSLRAKKGIKVRQPLRALYVPLKEGFSEDLWDLVKDELNVKEVLEKENLKALIEKNKVSNDLVNIIDKEETVALDVRIGKELKLEGEMRELVRQIQEGRKKANFNIEDRIALGYQGKEEIFEAFADTIKEEVLANEIVRGEIEKKDYEFNVNFGKEKVRIQLKKIN